MEEPLQQILNELQSINKRFAGFEKGQQELNEKFDSMEHRFDSLDQRLDSVEKKLTTLEEGQNRIEKRVNGIFEQTGGLLEFRTETIQRLEKLDGDIEILAGEMGKQKLDIERLKKRPV